MGGGKGGGGGPSQTTSTVTQSNLPAYAEPYFTRLMGNAEAETNQPYLQYPGARIQGFSADQQGAFGGVRSLAGAGNPTVDTAANLANSSGQQALNAGQYTPMYAQTGQWPNAAVNQYMNPYLENVLGRMQNRATQRYDEQALSRNTAAERAGAYGGSRQGIQNFLAQRELNQQLGDNEAQQYAQAYGNAQQMWGQDQQRSLQAQLANQGVDLQSAQLGLAGAQAGTQAADTLGRLGTAQQSLTMERLNALRAVGGEQQALAQRGLDTGYQDFINQRDFTRQNLSWLGGILHGIPVSPQSEVITTTPGPNPLSQALGLGIAGSQLQRMGNA